MHRPLIRAWMALALLGYGASAAAQQDTSATSIDTGAVRDSADAGRAAGAAAAHHRGVGGYFAAGLLSGVAIGAAGPVAVGEAKPDGPPMIVTGAGITGLVGISLYGASAGVTLPPMEEAHLQQHGARYQQAFRDAYTTQTQSRRKRATLWGGATGAVVGYGAILWLLTHIDT